MTTGTRVVLDAVGGAAAGLLTRPCCAIPMVLSALGLGSTGLAQLAATYRPVFLASGAIILGASFWVAFHRDGGSLAKATAAATALVSFAWSAAMWWF